MKFELKKDEALVHDGRIVYFKNDKSLNNSEGDLYLTSERLVYYKVGLGKQALLGAFARPFSKGNVEELNISLKDIIKVTEKKQGLGKKWVFDTQDSIFGISFRSEPVLWMNKIIAAIRALGENVEGDEHAFVVKHSKAPNPAESVEMSSDDALEKLSSAKKKLELELITQEEYDAVKEQLSKFII